MAKKHGLLLSLKVKRDGWSVLPVSRILSTVVYCCKMRDERTTAHTCKGGYHGCVRCMDGFAVSPVLGVNTHHVEGRCDVALTAFVRGNVQACPSRVEIVIGFICNASQSWSSSGWLLYRRSVPGEGPVISKSMAYRYHLLFFDCFLSRVPCDEKYSD